MTINDIIVAIERISANNGTVEDKMIVVTLAVAAWSAVTIYLAIRSKL